MSLLDNRTHITDIKGIIENGTTFPTDANNELAGLPSDSSGQLFYQNDLNQLNIHQGSGSWKQLQLTTTSTSTTTT